MLLQPKSFEEPASFFCRAFGTRMAIHDCLARFVDANALHQKDKPCHKCSQGQENRVEFAKS